MADYEHPADGPRGLHYAMEYNSLGQPIVRVTSSSGDLPSGSTTAWGEPYAIPITPVVQFDGAYGKEPLQTQNLIDIVQTGAGTVTNSGDGALVCTSGTSTGDTGAFFSTRAIPYRAGQGTLGRFTAAFTTGVANSNQRAGLSNGENSYMFGYSGSTFAIIHSYRGKSEIRTLTINTAATGDETATITLNGIAVTGISLTAGSTTLNAAQIARSQYLNVNGDAWRVDQIDNTVIFTSRTSRPYSGTFSFSSTGTAAGTFATTAAGVTPTTQVIPTTQWDYVPPSFDSTHLNVYQIQMRWLGSGAVTFSIENPDTGKMTVVHTKKWIPTGDTSPHLSKPNLRLGFAAAAAGTLASPMIMKMSSAMGAVEGVIQQNSYSLSSVNTDTTNRASGSVWHTLSLRNPWQKFNLANTQEIAVQRVDFAYQGNDPLVCYIFVNARASSALQFATVNTAQVLSSTTLGVTIDPATYQPNVTFTVPINGTGYIDLTPYRLVLAPGQDLNIGFLSNGNVSRTTTAVTFSINN
jgi:hypothetical protein